MDKVKATVNFEMGSMKVLDLCFEAVKKDGDGINCGRVWLAL